MMAYPSTSSARSVPPHVDAIVSALNFSNPAPEMLRTIPIAAWPAATSFADRSGLTIPLQLGCAGYLPETVRAAAQEKATKNAVRWKRIKNAYREIATALDGAGIHHTVLKGFSQYPLFCADPRHRAQYDIDLLLGPGEAKAAQVVAESLGYERALRGRRPVTDHLPSLIRKTGWTWQGDYFDPNIPLALEIHFRCWDRDTERFGPPNIERQFWGQSERRQCEDLSFLGLSPVDSVVYSCLHLVRHLLRGNLKPIHAYEMAWFLEMSASDEEWWREWDCLSAKDLRVVQGIAFGLAKHWFSPRMHPLAEACLSTLPESVLAWLAKSAFSPLAAAFVPNKDELWLHWCLLDSHRDRLAVAKRKLFPTRLPGPVAAVHVPAQQLTLRVRAKQQFAYGSYVVQRAIHHMRTAIPTLVGAFAWIFHNLVVKPGDDRGRIA